MGGVKCSKEVANAIRAAIILAKLSVIPIRRGYWGTKLGDPHTVPCKVHAKCGSVHMRLIPLLEVLVSLPRLYQRRSWRTLDTTTFTPRPRVAQLRWVTSPRLRSTLSLQPAHICRQTSGRRKFSRRLQSSTTPNTSPPSTLWPKSERLRRTTSRGACIANHGCVPKAPSCWQFVAAHVVSLMRNVPTTTI